MIMMNTMDTTRLVVGMNYPSIVMVVEGNVDRIIGVMEKKRS
jgi:hypothetical protein